MSVPIMSVEIDRYESEEATLLQYPIVRSIAAQFALDIHAGRVSLEYLDTWEGMNRVGDIMKSHGISYETIGGPARAVRKATVGFLEVFEEETPTLT